METTSRIAREGGCEVLIRVLTNTRGVTYGSLRKARIEKQGRDTVLQFRGPKSTASCWLLPTMPVQDGEFFGRLADGSMIVGRLL